MYYSMRGKVLLVKEELIVLEVNNIGYEILIGQTDTFSLNQEASILLI